MQEGIEKLKTDLNILEKMAENMNDYLRSEALFGRTGAPHMPQLTLGGYLMREHRLQALKNHLSDAERDRLSSAMVVFQNTMTTWTVRAETKAYKEVDARLRQWEETIREMRRNADENWSYYKTSVEVRVMLNELLDMLQNPPFQYDETYSQRISQLDSGFRSLWSSNDNLFVWQAAWQPAYPKKVFWFLYGAPYAVLRRS